MDATEVAANLEERATPDLDAAEVAARDLARCCALIPVQVPSRHWHLTSPRPPRLPIPTPASAAAPWARPRGPPGSEGPTLRDDAPTLHLRPEPEVRGHWTPGERRPAIAVVQADGSPALLLNGPVTAGTIRGDAEHPYARHDPHSRCSRPATRTGNHRDRPDHCHARSHAAPLGVPDAWPALPLGP